MPSIRAFGLRILTVTWSIATSASSSLASAGIETMGIDLVIYQSNAERYGSAAAFGADQHPP